MENIPSAHIHKTCAGYKCGLSGGTTAECPYDPGETVARYWWLIGYDVGHSDYLDVLVRQRSSPEGLERDDLQD